MEIRGSKIKWSTLMYMLEDNRGESVQTSAIEPWLRDTMAKGVITFDHDLKTLHLFATKLCLMIGLGPRRCRSASFSYHLIYSHISFFFGFIERRTGRVLALEIFPWIYCIFIVCVIFIQYRVAVCGNRFSLLLLWCRYYRYFCELFHLCMQGAINNIVWAAAGGVRGAVCLVLAAMKWKYGRKINKMRLSNYFVVSSSSFVFKTI